MLDWITATLGSACLAGAPSMRLDSSVLVKHR
jgi:hypothetical protein